MNLSNFKLLKENDDSYEIAHPSGKKMMLEKKGLSSQAHEMISSLKSEPKKYAEGGDVEDSDMDPSVNSSQEQTPEQALLSSIPSQPNQGVVDSFEFMSKPNQPGSTQALPTGSVGSLQNPSNSPLEAGLREQQQSAKDFANAVSGQGTAEVAAQKRAQQEIAALPSIADIQAKYAGADKSYKEALDNSKIDPNRFWHDKTVPAKIGSALGMLLSGIGAGVSHQQNMAQEYIQKAIDRDIDAQKNDQSKIMNAWKMNREAMGSDMAANIATRQQAYINLSHQLDQAASQFKGPMAQANYLNAKGKIDQELAINRWKMSMLQGPSKETAGGASAGSESAWGNHLSNLQMAFPEYYKDALAKTIPSVGVAKIPPTPDEKTELTNYDNLSKQLKEALEFQEKMGLSGAWTPQTKAQADTLKQNLILSMNQLNNSKRPPSPEIMKLYKDSVGGLGGVNLGGTKQSIKDLQEQVDRRGETLKSHLGVTPFSDASSSNIIRTQNGVQYQKVPGGWKKVQ